MGALAAEQGRLAGEVERLSGAVSAVQAQARVATVQDAPVQHTPLQEQDAPPPPPPAADDEAALDRLTARHLQAAALRHMPFLPGEIAVREDAIEVTGYCGAPEGLTADMAFFVNGRRFNHVEYPVLDPALKAKFAEEPGMGFVFRTRMTEHLDELRAARFLRFDASPTGRHVPGDWRRAVHFMNPAHERFPLPPAPNIQRVIGDTSQVRFAMGGAMIFKNLETYLGEQLGLGWADFPRILDWGCGAGRVTRYFLSETPAAVTGADIDPDNIAWCRSAYPGGDFQVVPLRPPTGFADGTFDLVTGLSVLTHLSEDDQWAWLSELRRITRPGALLFLSVQGPTQFAYNSFPPKLYRKLQEVGYIDFSRDPALDQVIEDSEYYRAAMHSRPYMVERWGDFFEVVAIVDAIAGLQDFVVLRRRG